MKVPPIKDITSKYVRKIRINSPKGEEKTMQLVVRPDKDGTIWEAHLLDNGKVLKTFDAVGACKDFDSVNHYLRKISLYAGRLGCTLMYMHQTYDRVEE